MPSARETGPGWARPVAGYLALALLVAVLAAVLAWQLAARSTIPASLHGEVLSVRAANEHPGTRNAWFVRIGEGTRQVDRSVGEELRVGDRVDKDAWARTMTVEGRPVSLELSKEARAALWFAPLLVLISCVLSWATWRRSSPGKSRGPAAH